MTLPRSYIVSSGIVELDAQGFMHVVGEGEHQPAQGAARVLGFAKDMLLGARRVRMPHTGEPVTVRVGLHTVRRGRGGAVDWAHGQSHRGMCACHPTDSCRLWHLSWASLGTPDRESGPKRPLCEQRVLG